MAGDKRRCAIRWTSAAVHAWLTRIERGFVVVAVVSLGWYVAARAAGARSDFDGNRELAELAAVRPAAAAAAGLAAPRSPHPPASSLVGRIEIPRLKLSAIVREGVDSPTLRRAVGHVPGTALPGEHGNVAIAGHRDTFFGALKDVRAGDRILLETRDGKFGYVVRETRVVEPTDVSVLDPTPDRTLTLVTCYPFQVIGSAPQRFIVRATSAAEAARP